MEGFIIQNATQNTSNFGSSSISCFSKYQNYQCSSITCVIPDATITKGICTVYLRGAANGERPDAGVTSFTALVNKGDTITTKSIIEIGSGAGGVPLDSLITTLTIMWNDRHIKGTSSVNTIGMLITLQPI